MGPAEYQHPPRLPSCAVDVAQMAAVLSSRKIGGYAEVRTVLNRTAAQVRGEVEEFLSSVEPEDLALVFTGHGNRATQTTSEFFFAATDTDRVGRRPPGCAPVSSTTSWPGAGRHEE